MNDETRHPPPVAADAADTADTAPQGPPVTPGETLPQTPDDVARAAAFPPPAAPDPASIPGYDILGELGRGGMGVVYKARQRSLHRVVALKMVLHGTPADLTRFLVEAESAAAVHHPHVIRIYDYGEHQGHLYMVLECLAGGSLIDRLRAGGRMEPRAAAELVMKIAGGVQAAHDLGIVHRDLKPHNVLLDVPPHAPPGAWGEPKVMDFGLAKRGGGADLTQTGAVMGTPAYMAPEQARGETKAVGPPADIYGLGVILYECLTGTVPFAGDDAWAVIRQVITTEPEPPARRAPGVPRDLDRVCRKCLAKEPADRYTSAAALADDLRRFLAGEAVRGPRSGLWDAARRAVRRHWRPGLAVVAVLALILAAWVIPSPLARFRDPPPGGEPKVEVRPPVAEREEDPIVRLRREEVVRRVDTLRRTKPAPDRAPPHAVTRLPDLPAADFTAFRVLSDERVVDLRGWRLNPTADPAGDGSVVYQTRRELVKVAPAAELRVEMRTSGRDVVMRGVRPNPEKVRAFAADKPGFVGEQAMKVRQLVFDVADVPVEGEFPVQFTNTYWHSLQAPDEWWFGVIGYEGSFKVAMLVVFPADRPFRTYQLKTAPTRADDPEQRKPVPYTGPVITFAAEDKSWLYWEIPGPKANHVYRVDWTW